MKENKENNKKDSDNIDKAFDAWINVGKELGKVEEHTPKAESNMYYPTIHLESPDAFNNLEGGVGDSIELMCKGVIKSVSQRDPDRDGDKITEVCIEVRDVAIGEHKPAKEKDTDGKDIEEDIKEKKEEEDKEESSEEE